MILRISTQEKLAQIALALQSDKRCQALHFGLLQLSKQQLCKVQAALREPEGMVLDTFNYDAERKLWCPLAVGLGVPEIAAHEFPERTVSNRYAKGMIKSIGRSLHGSFNLNPVSGVSGSFFRSHRASDLRELVDFMLAERE